MGTKLANASGSNASDAARTTGAPAPDPCQPWTTKVLAHELGSLENVLPDGHDGLLFSASDHDAVQRLTRDGRITTVVADVIAPGGLRMRDGALYVNSGDSLQSGALGTKDGVIYKADLRTGKKTVWAKDLIMPNGLLLLPDGSALTSRDVPGVNASGITRVAKQGAAPQYSWADQNDSNGMDLDPSGKYVYADETFTYGSKLYRITIANPRQRVEIASLTLGATPPMFKGLDDLDVASSGIIYLAANLTGQVIRLDPATGKSCVIASKLHNTSAVKQGIGGKGAAFPASRLYATGFDGRIVEITPPAGVTP